jgi:hypothetical protein
LLSLLVATRAFAQEHGADDSDNKHDDPNTQSADESSERTAAPTRPKEETKTVPSVDAGPVHVNFFGSLRPTAEVAYFPEGLNRDRVNYGATGSAIDVGADAQAGAGVSGAFYLRFFATRDANGGTSSKVALERAVLQYEPLRGLVFIVGKEGIPLSAQSATPTLGRVFPTGVDLVGTFVVPADVGLQARYYTDRVSIFTGAWNGIASDAILEPGASERGFLYSARVEVTPFGPMEFNENMRPTTARIGIGAAMTYRAATTYTAVGTEAVHSRDLRAAASIRAAWQFGLFLQAEILRKQVTDDLSSRPDVATGGYVQASWRFKVRNKVDVAPVARAGVQYVRQLSMPATGTEQELGVAVYPLANGNDRLQLSTMLMRLLRPDRGPELQALVAARLAF